MDVTKASTVLDRMKGDNTPTKPVYSAALDLPTFSNECTGQCLCAPGGRSNYNK